MTVLSIRGVDDKVAEELKKKAKSDGCSVNSVVLSILGESLGLKKKKRNIVYNDLDDLAGTWNKKDAKEFKKNISQLEKIDKSMWK